MREEPGNNPYSNLTSVLGARILSEANDLKRTLKALAQEIEVDEVKLSRIVKGECTVEDCRMVIEKMGGRYPIDHTDLFLFEDDCLHGVKWMRASDSKANSRTFARKDKNGRHTDYYEYRDTAMSKISPFRPEWIRMIRPVEDHNPYNPDVAYNNGHSLHQMTFFVGPVNFYWEVNGKKYCREMSTGDSNYITPFWPHSFTTRDQNKTTLILAVTFGGDVRRAQRELYALGERGIKNYVLDIRKRQRGIAQLIQMHMRNENMTMEIMQDKLKDTSIDIKAILHETQEPSLEELKIIADIFHIEVFDLLVPQYNYEEEVVVKQKSESDRYFHPSSRDKKFTIYPLARCSKMPLAKGFDVTVLASEVPRDQYFNTSLHSYIYNYGDNPIWINWLDQDIQYSEILNPDDSIFIQPFIPHTFVTISHREANLCVMRVSGAMNLTTQRELSYFARHDRVIEETCWFD